MAWNERIDELLGCMIDRHAPQARTIYANSNDALISSETKSEGRVDAGTHGTAPFVELNLLI
jgi:hypothetical protein